MNLEITTDTPLYRVAVHCVIFGFPQNKLSLLVVDQNDGMLGFPQCVMKRQESLDETAIDLLNGVTEAQGHFLKQVCTFVEYGSEALKQDASVHVVYFSLLPPSVEIKEVMGQTMKWVDLQTDAFTARQREIILWARNKLKRRISVEPVAFRLLPELFTLSRLQSLYERKLEIRDWGIQFGAQYTIDLNERNSLTLGAVYIPKKSFHGTALACMYDVNNSSDIDTVSNVSMKDRFSSPATYGGGVAWNLDNRLTVAADFTYQNWADAKYENLANFENVVYDNRWKIAAGASFTPNVRGNYLQRMTYRVGGHFNHDYIKVLGNNVRDYGVSVGFGLPAPSSKTVINIGFEYKHRAAYPDNLISENYFNITVGINFNEMWFWQNKIK